MTLDTRITLSGLWTTVMLIYLMGDVLRVYSGDAARMEAAEPSTNIKWLGAAIIMLIPISMVALSLILPYDVARWANILVGGGFILFVLADVMGYPSAYDRFLLLASVVFKGMIVWYAWHWSATAVG
jgi:hypothetical protein